MSNQSSCVECGYSLRGLTPGRPCPECGHFSPESCGSPPSHAAWARCVFVGLALALVLTLTAVASVLVQPFEEIGGTAPALNLPAPKLWAVPLLQRPIGRRPELPGVLGTRAAMLGLLAVWLITAPGAVARLGRDETLRIATRWTSVALFGLAFGALTAAQGLWPSELPPFRMLLVAAVELPSAVLLYLYLRRLAEQVPGRARRESFARLAWLVPVVMVGAVALLSMQWKWGSIGRSGLSRNTVVALGTMYGAVAVTVGVAATAAVASLCAAYFQVGFPLARRLISGGRYLARRTRKAIARPAPGRASLLAVGAGAVLLVVNAFLGLDLTVWMPFREGVGGNLPYLNFPGPKFWATAAIMRSGSLYSWQPLVSGSTFLCLNIAAIWLVTARSGTASWLRNAARWTPVVALALAIAVVAATRNGGEFGVDFRGAYYSRFFMLVVAFGELPATLLLYWWLSRVAAELGRPRLAWAFRRLCGAILALVAGAFAMFVMSRSLLTVRTLPEILFIASVYAVISLGSAAWAIASLVSLAATAMTCAWRPAACEPSTQCGDEGRIATAMTLSAALPQDDDLEVVPG